MAIKSLAQTLKDLTTGIKNTVTSVTGSNATLTITKGNGTTSTIDLIPAGTMQMFAGKTIPAGWLLCDGSAVSRTDYAKLFSAIGTTWGAGDGSTTFNLPNTIGRFVEGSATSGTVLEAGLPNITGKIDGSSFDPSVELFGEIHLSTPVSGAYGLIGGSQHPVYETGSMIGNLVRGIDFDASRSNAIYGNSTTVQPNAITMKYIIKY